MPLGGEAGSGSFPNHDSATFSSFLDFFARWSLGEAAECFDSLR
jgi:hypothetical protein